MTSFIRKTNLLLNYNKKWFSNNFIIKPHFNENQFIRNFMKKVIAESEQNSNLNMKSLIKPFTFTIGFSGTAFALSMVWNYENTIAFRNRFNNNWNNWMQSTNRKEAKYGHLRNELNEWWNSRSEGFKLFSAIALINGLVFIGWRIPYLGQQKLMVKYFMTHLNTKSLKCWPMVFSTFSHHSLIHLSMNMIVLHSFADIGVHLFGKEQFLALYLSSGVISSFASYAYKVLASRTGSSLGASGAILGVVAANCIARPDLQLVIVFLPFFTISAGMAIKGLLALDTAGLILKWGFFDHAAHVGGALFGIWYTTYGQTIIWNNKSKVIKVWQQIKNQFN